MGYTLTKELIDVYNWRPLDNEKCFSFVDWDAATLGSDELTRREKRIERGRPRFEISFYVIPKKGKRGTCIRLHFDDNAEYIKTETWSSLIGKKELKAIVDDAFEYLIKNGWVRKEN